MRNMRVLQKACEKGSQKISFLLLPPNLKSMPMRCLQQVRGKCAIRKRWCFSLKSNDLLIPFSQELSEGALQSGSEEGAQEGMNTAEVTGPTGGHAVGAARSQSQRWMLRFSFSALCLFHLSMPLL